MSLHLKETVHVLLIKGGYSESGKSFTLNATEVHGVCYSVDCRNLALNENKSGTLQAKEDGGYSYNYLNPVLMEKKDE